MQQPDPQTQLFGVATSVVFPFRFPGAAAEASSRSSGSAAAASRRLVGIPPSISHKLFCVSDNSVGVRALVLPELPLLLLHV